MDHPKQERPSGIRLVSINELDYPSRLRSIEFAPQYLYLIGNVPQTTGPSPIAIVGSRAASQQGLDDAFGISATLAQRGHTVVSGLASGIDSAAHRGALSVQGNTIAVVGTGVDRVYPPENTDLRNKIAQHGTIVSQFPLGHGPSKTTFPARNALIAGLSDVSLLIEMSERSGTRIEANLALEQQKPVLLWAPILGASKWAKRFARHPLVNFVDSTEQIAKILEQAR